MRREQVAFERLHELLSYDMQSGVFTWLKTTNRRIRVGSTAGVLDNVYGYIHIGIDGVIYRAHRLAWFYLFASWPVEYLDHIDGNRANNSIFNLRECTQKQNLENTAIRSDSTTGYPGVGFMPAQDKWRARITHYGKERHLGVFDTVIDAVAAKISAERQLFSHRNESRRQCGS